MICHILFESEYSYRYFQLIHQNFEKTNHVFIIVARSVWKENKKYDYKNSIYDYRLNNIGTLQILEKSKVVIIHGLFHVNILEFLYKQPEILAKSVWLVWGGDIYPCKNSMFKDIVISSMSSLPKIKAITKTMYNSFRLSLENKLLPYQTSSIEIMRRKVISNFKAIISVCYGDYLIIKNTYKTKAKFIYGSHPLIINWNLVNCLLNEKNNNSKNTIKKILVGNSATKTNCHVDAFKKISKFSKVKVYCPLSYGTQDYKETTIKEGYMILGNRFIPLTEFIDNNEYIRFLSLIDVAVMNHNRQQALGNILTLLLLGKKVFMRDDVSSSQMLKEKKIKVYDINQLDQFQDSNDFCMISDDIVQNNRNIVINNFSDERWLDLWQQIFKSL